MQPVLTVFQHHRPLKTLPLKRRVRRRQTVVRLGLPLEETHSTTETRSVKDVVRGLAPSYWQRHKALCITRIYPSRTLRITNGTVRSRSVYDNDFTTENNKF